MNEDEYRYLTFLFCDLVGSTPLSQELDHEDWRFVLGQFRKCCLDQVRDHGGVVHESQGDGFLFYFGFPVAYEDSAVRAIRAALAIINDCRQNLSESNAILRRHGQPELSARVGVHSGQVVIGQIDGQNTATGFPLAYTVRLHTLADPNSIVISDETRHLVAGEFRIADRGYAALKGIDYPVAYHEVLSNECNEPVATDGLTFVGRHTEIEHLKSEWKRSMQGTGRAVSVSGEAGIGKSRLLQELATQIADTRCSLFQWRCLSQACSIAMNPVIQGLGNLVSANAGDTRDNETPDRVDPDEAAYWLSLLTDPTQKMATTQSASSQSDNKTVAMPLISSAEERKRWVLDGLVSWLIAQSQKRPLVLVLEDAHWIDPSTQAFVTLLISRLEASSILLLISYRTDADNDWESPFAVPNIALNRITEPVARALITSMPGSDDLSAHDIDRLVQRSDGVPLFIEESTAMMIDKHDLFDEASPQHAAFCRVDDKVPSRLMNLLAARLDQTGNARITAGLAASIGREFSHELLNAVSDIDANVVSRHLETLLQKGLLKCDDEMQRLYYFKHELVRDAAYSTLLKSTRRLYHGRIAKALDAGITSKAAVEPEILAYHFGEAQMKEQALDCWLLAARTARLNSNPVEATRHFAHVKTLLTQLPEDSDYLSGEKELEMLTGLGACHIALDGYGSDDAKECFESAEPIALRLRKADKVTKIRFGLEAYHFMRGEFSKALEISQTCFDSATTELNNLPANPVAHDVTRAELSLAQSSWALGNVHFHKGNFKESMPLLRQCILLCQSPQCRGIQLAHNPDVMSQLYCAWYECETGAMENAKANVEKIVEQAHQAGHAYTHCVALAFAACIYFFRGEYGAAIVKAEQSIQLSEAPRFLTWLAWAKVLRGRSLCEQESTRMQGLSEIDEGIELWDKSGAIVTRPFALALRAESLLLHDDVKRAQASIDLAVATMDKFGERYYEAEIYRIKGVLCRRSHDFKGAEQCFERSMGFASKRGMWRSVIRSAIEQVRLNQQTGSDCAAVQTLVQARKRTQGGQELQDLKVADDLIKTVTARNRLANA